jgi:hypothetical protein
LGPQDNVKHKRSKDTENGAAAEAEGKKPLTNAMTHLLPLGKVRNNVAVP